MTYGSEFPSTIVDSPDASYFIWPVASVFIANTILFILCQLPCGKRDNSWIDCVWGIIFCIPNAVVILLRAFSGKEDAEWGITKRMVFITVPVFIWGFRLGIYIFIRHKSEDYRYKNWRIEWEKKGDCYYYTRAFL